jgi:hypothetical protein
VVGFKVKMEIVEVARSWHKNSLRKRGGWHEKRGVDKVVAAWCAAGCSGGMETKGWVIVRIRIGW